MRLGVARRSQPRNVHGLAGLGDLVLTCTTINTIRRFVGTGGGRTPQNGFAEIGQVVEGSTAAKAAYAVAKRMNVEMPLCTGGVQSPV